MLSQPHAISGLGGIGKTQTAIEYAYRYRDEYDAVLWAKADSREALNSDFVAIAGALQLPEKDAQDQSLTVNAVKQWLERSTDWLLILDNADDLSIAQAFLPTTGKGHILLTTRARPMGKIAQRVELDTMEPEEGALLLLRRAGILSPDAPLAAASAVDRAHAFQLVAALGGLPLALDQAGAYIEETGSALSRYLELYQTRRQALLRRRSKLPTDHPEPVATTWSLSFQQVEQANPAAAELLRFCAFLHPDAIPEELIAAGAPDLGVVLEPVARDSLQLDEAIAELQRFSLVRRHSDTNTLSVHRLVQAVLKDRMSEDQQRQWVAKTIHAINRVFPVSVDVATWSLCQRYIVHVQNCLASLIQWNLGFPEAAHLLNRAANYLHGRAQYTPAEQLLQHALRIREAVCGTEHPDTASTLHDLATLYLYQGHFKQVEPLYRRALAIREKALGPDHPDTAMTLNNLASLYYNQGKYEQAEPLYQRALTIYEKALGTDHPDTAWTLNNLALLYSDQGKYEQAEPLFQRALAIKEKALEPDHPSTAGTLNNLAILYRNQGKYKQAEPLFQRALAIREKALGPDHPDTAMTLNNLAILYRNQGKYEQAESLFQQALTIKEKALGADHPVTASTLHSLANLYENQGKYEQAEPLFQRALAIREKALGRDHPETVKVRENYTNLLQKMKKKAE